MAADKQASGPFRSMRDTAKEIARMLRWHRDNKGEEDLSRWNCTAKQKQKRIPPELKIPEQCIFAAVNPLCRMCLVGVSANGAKIQVFFIKKYNSG